MITINDLIIELQSLKPSLRELPVVIVAPNKMLFEPKAKIFHENGAMFYEPKKMVITYD